MVALRSIHSMTLVLELLNIPIRLTKTSLEALFLKNISNTPINTLITTLSLLATVLEELWLSMLLLMFNGLAKKSHF